MDIQIEAIEQKIVDNHWSLTIPTNYRPLLGLRETEIAIKEIKDFFESHLAGALHLVRVSAPLFVRAGTGLNDDLNGVEKPVTFPVAALDGESIEVVQSLAKWKRYMLGELAFPEGEGLYTDMNAIRPDENMDNLHSIYVDQWDWEKVIPADARNQETLRATVREIYDVICRTEFHLASRTRGLRPVLPEHITFLTSQELLDRYPGRTPLERESAAAREFGAIFIIGIGGALSDGTIHDGRAPDYDDWSTPREDGGFGLNGDLIVWHPVLGRAFELSSMGVRVSPEVLRNQLAIRHVSEWASKKYHQKLLAGELPCTIGGGIGQSRLCMFFLRTAHIGEVSVGVWPEGMIESCRQHGIPLL
ncbi:MAG: aspartate--ammonia ligase [Deltaproteobacteria bacterium HGW-Deltaproteobacteria-17]|nr:MAG: aspartate--ammonia ligase [Deltaproteobacteria bacterium HGW-Deltaproteobacteria-17]